MTEPGPHPQKPTLLGALVRQPFAIMGGLGILNFAHDAVEWNRSVLSWIDAWRSFTRPIVEFSIGWVPALLHLPFPDWTKDYFSMGLVIGGSDYRAMLAAVHYRYPQRRSEHRATLRFTILFISDMIRTYMIMVLMWPILLLDLALRSIMTLLYRSSSSEEATTGPPDTSVRLRVFLESAGWAAIIMVASYVLRPGHGS